MELPLYLHSDIRTATGPYEILFKPAQMAARGGSSLNISFPWPMFAAAWLLSTMPAGLTERLLARLPKKSGAAG